jgi:hypothetical protein
MTVKGIWCVELATGEVKWKRLVENAGTASPVLVDGKVISFIQHLDRGDDGWPRGRRERL